MGVKHKEGSTRVGWRCRLHIMKSSVSAACTFHFLLRSWWFEIRICMYHTAYHVVIVLASFAYFNLIKICRKREEKERGFKRDVKSFLCEKPKMHLPFGSLDPLIILSSFSHKWREKHVLLRQCYAYDISKILNQQEHTHFLPSITQHIILL